MDDKAARCQNKVAYHGDVNRAVASEGNMVFRAKLPRLYELKDSFDAPASPEAYFRDFDENLARSAHVEDI
jgi:hypothetical protein